NGTTMTHDPAPLTRRRVIALGTGLAVAGLMDLSMRPTGAAPRIDVTPGNSQPLPIAIPDFLGSDTAVAHGVRDIIASNLQRSGLFAPIEQAAYIEKISNFDAYPRYSDWKQINAQALVTGRLSRLPDGRLAADFRLWDVIAGAYIDGKSYQTPPD